MQSESSQDFPMAQAEAGPHVLDDQERRRMLRRRVERIGKWCLPAIVLVITVWYWDRIVFWNEIPHYILPGPGRVASTLLADWSVLLDALVITLQITFSRWRLRLSAEPGSPSCSRSPGSSRCPCFPMR